MSETAGSTPTPLRYASAADTPVVCHDRAVMTSTGPRHPRAGAPPRQSPARGPRFTLTSRAGRTNGGTGTERRLREEMPTTG